MKFKKLLVCSLLLSTSISQSMAMNHKEDKKFHCAKRLIFAVICIGTCFLAFNEPVGNSIHYEMYGSEYPSHSEVSPFRLCDAGYRYGWHDATSHGSPAHISHCRGFTDENTRNKIKKTLIDYGTSAIVGNCRAGYYEGLADGYTSLPTELKAKHQFSDKTSCSDYLTKDKKERLKKPLSWYDSLFSFFGCRKQD